MSYAHCTGLADDIPPIYVIICVIYGPSHIHIILQYYEIYIFDIMAYDYAS